MRFAREGTDVAIVYVPCEQKDAEKVLQLVNTVVRRTVQELGSLNILVNHAAEQNWRDLLADIKDEELDSIFDLNMKSFFWVTRAGRPSEVAPAYVFLASEDASYFAGQTLHLNGGGLVNA